MVHMEMKTEGFSVILILFMFIINTDGIYSTKSKSYILKPVLCLTRLTSMINMILRKGIFNVLL